MRLNEINVKNLRLFKDAEQTISVDSEKDILVLLGDNGAGKSSLLYGITVALSQYFEPFPGISIKQFTDADIYSVSETRKADYLRVKLGLGLPQDLDFGTLVGKVVDVYRKGYADKTPTSYLTELKEYALAVKGAIDRDEVVELPILAYYGTERGQIKAPERRREFNSVFPRWDAYEDALEPATNFKRFFTWFERNEDIENREQKKRQDWSYRNPVLDVVREALSKLEENLQNPRVEISPLRFVMDDVSDPKNPHEVRIESMSDGYRIMIAMVADIAARMAEANPSKDVSGLKNPLETHGIVLIDEVDLHLHPRWQRIVLKQLHTIFPNVQFIVSTHSPNAVIGALDIAQVVKLNAGTIDDTVKLADYFTYDVSLMLLSPLFSLDNVRSDKFKVLEQELDSLIDKRDRLTKADKRRMLNIMDQLSEYKSVVSDHDAI